MLKDNDKKLYDLIQKEAHRQDEEIELIASENYVSRDVLEANASILTNKYSEWYSGKRYYAWNEVIDEVETLAIERAKELFWAEYVNVQPLSWSPANLAIYLWLLKPGAKVLWLALDQWWHLSHGHPLNFSWILYEIIPYFLDKETETIDMDEVERIALETKPEMIIAWFSAYTRNLDWKRFREIADKAWAILMSDISHIAWLIAWKALENPIPYCDVVMTTTHKTLRWPRWAIIMAREKYAKDLNRAVFPWVQWGPHNHTNAAKAVAFGEALRPEFQEYAKQIIKNAKALASEIEKNWFKLVSGWTDNHIVLVDVFSSKNVTAKEAEAALTKVWLSVNVNMVPYDTRKPMDPSWIRIWTPAATTRWMKEEEMKIIWRIFSESIINKDNEEKLIELRQEVLDLCKKFPIYK
jgi:glycine hydroxymethyltransferase